VVSPVISSIYLDRLDKFIEQALMPAYNRGARRTPYRPYMRLWQRACRLEQRGKREAGRALRKQMQALPSRDPADPGYRRLRYCRYADDWLLGFTGPRQEAEQIKACIGQFLRDQLKLELSPAKTLITHGRTQAARFLGYEIVVLHADDKHDHRGHRSINAAIGLKVPADVIRAKCKPCLHHGRPIRRTERIADTDFSIVAQFQAEFRGVAEYCKLAFNRHRLGRLKYVMERSLTKTLARKYRIRAAPVYRRYRAVLATEHGPRRGLQVTVHRDGGRPPLVAHWGGISLARDTTPAVLNDDPPRIWSGRSELVQRLLADACELCRLQGPGRGTPHPCPQRPQLHGAQAPTRMGHADGYPPPQDPRRLPRLPRGHPHRAPSKAATMSTGEPDATEIGHVRFGGGAGGKGPGQLAPRRRPTLPPAWFGGGAGGKGPGQGHLAGGRLHAAGGPGKPAGSNPGRAPRSDPTIAAMPSSGSPGRWRQACACPGNGPPRPGG